MVTACLESCPAARIKLLDSQRTVIGCLEACPEGFYQIANECRKCSEGCSTCTNGGSADCSGCINGRTILKQTLESTKFSCIEDKDLGKKNVKIRSNPDEYIQCPENCSDCKIDAGRVICTQCLQGFGFASGEGSQCVSRCRETEFWVPSTRQCKKCSGDCYSCARSPTNCTKCQKSLAVVKNQMGSNECVSACPGGTALKKDSEGFKLCQQCAQNCQKCEY